MPDYRAFFVGGDGHFIGFEPIICDDDSEAIERAKRLVDGHDVELWSGARLVVVLQHTSDEVRDEVRALNWQIDQSQRVSKNAKGDDATARMDRLTHDLEQERDDQQRRDDEK